MTSYQVAVIGAGAMGAPIARHLAAAGHEVVVYDVQPEAAVAAAQAGATAVRSLADLPACDVALLLVPTDADVLDAGGQLVPLLPAGAVIAICSSARPETCRRLGEVARQRDIHVVDAALTGGVRAAEAGRISMLAGGDADLVTRLDPVFRAFCGRVTHLGALGCGQVGKTANNLLHWATIAAITEAFTLGERLGVPAPRLCAALIGGPTDSRTLRDLGQFRLTWWAKDMDNAMAMAAASGMNLPLARQVQEAMPSITTSLLSRCADLSCNGQTIQP